MLSDPQKREMYDLGGDPFVDRRRRSAPGFGFSDIMDAFFGAGGGAARPAAAAAPRPGRPDPGRARPGRGGVRRHPRAPGRHRGGLPDLHRRGRRARHRRRAPATMCHGRGEVQQVTRSLPRPGDDLPAVPAVPGLRHRDPAPVPRVRRRRPGAHAAARSRSRSRPASTPAPASSSPARARSAPAAARPATCTSRSSSARTRCSSGSGDDLHCTVAVPMTAAALGTTVDAGDARRAEHGRHPRRAPSPASVIAARPRRHRTCAAAGRGDLHRARRGARRRPGSTPSRRSCCASWPRCAARTARTRAVHRPASRASSPGCATPSTSAEPP